MPRSYAAACACALSFTSCSTAAGRRVSQAASATLLECSSRRWRASFAAAVVLPEPCRPAIMITVGGLAEKLSGAALPPIRLVSSSATIFTTCWPGLRRPITSAPVQRSRRSAVSCLTTWKLTSASSSASRISRIVSSTSRSVSVPRLRTSASVPCSFCASESNTARRLAPAHERYAIAHGE